MVGCLHSLRLDLVLGVERSSHLFVVEWRMLLILVNGVMLNVPSLTPEVVIF